MNTSRKHHLLHNHLLHLIVGLVFGVEVLSLAFKSSAQDLSLVPYNNFFSSYSKAVNISYHFGGNNFTGILARSGWLDLATPEKVMLSGDITGIYCSKKLQGLYYNGVRGSKVRPLEGAALQELKSIDSNSYSTMEVAGGFYTACSGTSINSNFVIGQITHNQGGSVYNLFAGLRYDLSQNILKTGQDLIGGTLLFGNNTFQGTIYDNYGGGIGDINSGSIYISPITPGGFSGAIFYPGIANIKNAELKKIYQSDAFSVLGLPSTSNISISGGFLYINGSGMGTTGTINNNDKVQIDLISSSEYDTTTSSFITITTVLSGSLTGTFSITTKNNNPDECDLTKSEKAKVEESFSGFKAEYGYNISKRNNMLSTMKSMIDDIQDFDYNCSLSYLQELVEGYIDEDPEVHTAPNCKEYPVVYDETRKGYTSSKFKIKQYFASRDALVKFIDSKNPGDCHINTYGTENEEYDITDDTLYVAPNGKVYEIKEESSSFSSPTMNTKRTFSSKENLTDFIDRYNPLIEVRDHEVDTSFTPIIFATTNSKEYKIYKTDKGYMSYKMVKVQYFSTLEEIESYLERNNKK